MTPITIQGKPMLIVDTKPNVFECRDCACDAKQGGTDKCVRVHDQTKELYFETLENVGLRDGQRDALYCIAGEHDIVFINDTPEDIARYVAARLESA
jgi:hypothetical protein